MKRITQILMFISFAFSYAQNAGDILFIGFNANGDSDFAIVSMVDLPPNTEIYFTDNEPNVDGNGNSNSEGVLLWSTGASVISKGTVVVFTDIDSGSNTNFGVSVGSLSVTDAGFNISTSGDAIYASYGNPSENEVTQWIAGIQNSNGGLETNFSATGLNVSSNFVVIAATASKDGGVYSGTRINKTEAEFATLITNESNWTTSTSDGESLLPFSSVVFSFSVLSNPKLTAVDVGLQIKNNKFVCTNATILGVVNIVGQQVANYNLGTGLYFVEILYGGAAYKLKVIKQ